MRQYWAKGTIRRPRLNWQARSGRTQAGLNRLQPVQLSRAGIVAGVCVAALVVTAIAASTATQGGITKGFSQASRDPDARLSFLAVRDSAHCARNCLLLPLKASRYAPAVGKIAPQWPLACTIPIDGSICVDCADRGLGLRQHQEPAGAGSSHERPQPHAGARVCDLDWGQHVPRCAAVCR